MCMWVVFKQNTFEVANEVYFHDSFETALDFRDYKNLTTNHYWTLAEVFPEKTWYGKLLIWLARKGD